MATCRVWRPLTASVLSGFVGLSVAFGQGPADKELDAKETAKRLGQVAAQKTEADLRAALRDVQKLQANSPKKAAERLTKLLVSVETDTTLTDARRDALKRMLQDRIRTAEAEADNAAGEAAALTEKQTQDAIKAAEQEKQAAAAELTRRRQNAISDLQKQGKTEEAKKLATELNKEQPANPSVQATGRTAGTLERDTDARKMRAEAEDRRMAAFRDVEKSAQLPRGDIEFPDDWKERTKNRRAGVELTAKEQAILKALNTPVTVRFKGSRFEDVIEYLQTITGQTIFLDKAALDEAQVKYDAPVTISVRGVSVRTLLRKILSDLNLSYVVKDEVIQVTSAEKAKEMLVVRSYYIGDIILGAGGNPVQAMQTVNQIIEMVQNSVDAASWRANGGSGSITFSPASMSLIIRQSAEVHAKLAEGFGK